MSERHIPHEKQVIGLIDFECSRQYLSDEETTGHCGSQDKMSLLITDLHHVCLWWQKIIHGGIQKCKNLHWAYCLWVLWIKKGLCIVCIVLFKHGGLIPESNVEINNCSESLLEVTSLPYIFFDDLWKQQQLTMHEKKDSENTFNLQVF